MEFYFKRPNGQVCKEITSNLTEKCTRMVRGRMWLQGSEKKLKDN